MFYYTAKQKLSYLEAEPCYNAREKTLSLLQENLQLKQQLEKLKLLLADETKTNSLQSVGATKEDMGHLVALSKSCRRLYLCV